MLDSSQRAPFRSKQRGFVQTDRTSTGTTVLERDFKSKSGKLDWVGNSMIPLMKLQRKDFRLFFRLHFNLAENSEVVALVVAHPHSVHLVADPVDRDVQEKTSGQHRACRSISSIAAIALASALQAFHS